MSVKPPNLKLLGRGGEPRERPEPRRSDFERLYPGWGSSRIPRPQPAAPPGKQEPVEHGDA